MIRTALLISGETEIIPQTLLQPRISHSLGKICTCWTWARSPALCHIWRPLNGMQETLCIKASSTCPQTAQMMKPDKWEVSCKSHLSQIHGLRIPFLGHIYIREWNEANVPDECWQAFLMTLLTCQRATQNSGACSTHSLASPAWSSGAGSQAEGCPRRAIRPILMCYGKAHRLPREAGESRAVGEDPDNPRSSFRKAKPGRKGNIYMGWGGAGGLLWGCKIGKRITGGWDGRQDQGRKQNSPVILKCHLMFKWHSCTPTQKLLSLFHTHTLCPLNSRPEPSKCAGLGRRGRNGCPGVRAATGGGWQEVRPEDSHGLLMP